MAKWQGRNEWAKFLRDADERVRQAAADALNAASDDLIAKMKSNMARQGIQVRTGKLISSFKVNRATAASPNVVIENEVYKPLPRNQRRWRRAVASAEGQERKRMRSLRPSRYKYPPQGVPYGRIIEFSPRINKPFFYTAWYDMRRAVKARVMASVGNAWSGKT